MSWSQRRRAGGDDLLDAGQLAAGEIDPHREYAAPDQIVDLLTGGHQPHLGNLHAAGLAGNGDHVHAGLQLVDGDNGMRNV